MAWNQVPKQDRPPRPTPMRPSRINPPKPPEPKRPPKPPDTPGYAWRWRKLHHRQPWAVGAAHRRLADVPLHASPAPDPLAGDLRSGGKEAVVFRHVFGLDPERAGDALLQGQARGVGPSHVGRQQEKGLTVRANPPRCQRRAKSSSQ